MSASVHAKQNASGVTCLHPSSSMTANHATNRLRIILDKLARQIDPLRFAIAGYQPLSTTN